MVSFSFKNVFIDKYYTVASMDEANGNCKNIDYVIPSYDNYEKTFEQAEISINKMVLDFFNNNYDIVIGGDLQNQICASSYANKNNNKSFLGVYNACATFNEALIVMGSLIDSKKVRNGLVITSSHKLVSEKTFRYPVEYGGPKLRKSTSTSTGSVGCILTSNKTKIKIINATIGSVVDMGISDALNMGAVMAPACVDTFINHLNDFNIDPSYYDVILTGDLGEVGSNIFNYILNSKYNIKLKNHIDAGSIMYKENQGFNSGASGPVTLPLILFGNILSNKKYKKILLLATGALHSSCLVNQKLDIPSICHAVSLEVNNDLN